MFTVTKEQVAAILEDFKIASGVAEFTELQRSHYDMKRTIRTRKRFA